jgi:peptidyl-prolyl cis-trans isomerase SurA
LLTIKEGTWYKGDNETIDNLDRGKMQQETIIDGFPSIIVTNKLIDAVPLPLSEVQGEILTAYQEYLETNWVKQLKGKYSVKIDRVVLEEIRKNLNNE